MINYYVVAILCHFILIMHLACLPYHAGSDNFLEALSLFVIAYAATKNASAGGENDWLATILVYLTLAVILIGSIVEFVGKLYFLPRRHEQAARKKHKPEEDIRLTTFNVTRTTQERPLSESLA